MAGPDGQLETAITLILADAAPELAEAHDELYPGRVAEGIPLSLTLLYPFAPARPVAESELEVARSFLASRAPLLFAVPRVAQWESGAIYGVPEPDDELRATMRGLWRLFPQYPPYRGMADDPPPHVSLTLDGGDDAPATLGRVEQRLERLLPVRFEIGEAALIEEYAPDRWRVRTTFPLGEGEADPGTP
jgi:2'-5' RNA ligase superfamily